MIWLNILGNEMLLMVAETLLIVVGSMLMGILLSYLFWGKIRQQIPELQSEIAAEKRHTEDLRDQLQELVQIREQLKNELSEIRIKAETQARTILDHHHISNLKEAEFRQQRESIDQLKAVIQSYQNRLAIIEEELTQAKNAVLIPHKTPLPQIVRANYEHVSKLLGKTVTENDLTLISGIGPKTASLLHSKGITTWKALSEVQADDLREILAEAGGIYKSHDPSTWPKQALMASQSEWRKLRVYQETLKKHEEG